MVLSCISAPGNKHSFSAQSWPLNGPLLHYGRLFYISPGNDEITTHSKFFQASSNRQNTQYDFFYRAKMIELISFTVGQKQRLSFSFLGENLTRIACAMSYCYRRH